MHQEVHGSEPHMETPGLALMKSVTWAIMKGSVRSRASLCSLTTSIPSSFPTFPMLELASQQNSIKVFFPIPLRPGGRELLLSLRSLYADSITIAASASCPAAATLSAASCSISFQKFMAPVNISHTADIAAVQPVRTSSYVWPAAAETYFAMLLSLGGGGASILSLSVLSRRRCSAPASCCDSV